MSGLIEWLEKLNEKDSKVRAILRRSLSFEPGQYVPAFPYIEPFLKDIDDSWAREVHYLIAALWAAHWREGRAGVPIPLALACAEHQNRSGSASTEARFVHLLDADPGQLPYRLRQMMALLGDQPIDFDELLKDLLRWNWRNRGIQNKWARKFYRNLKQDSQS